MRTRKFWNKKSKRRQIKESEDQKATISKTEIEKTGKEMENKQELEQAEKEDAITSLIPINPIDLKAMKSSMISFTHSNHIHS